VTLEVAPVSDIVLVDGRADRYTPSPLSPGQEGPVGRLKLKTRESTPEGRVPTLQRLTVAAGGTSPPGIDSLALWRSSDDLFDAGADAEIASVGYGSSATFSGIEASIPSSGTVYFFLVAELSREAEGQYHPLVPDEEAVRLSGGTLSTYNGTRTSTFADAYLAEQPTPLPVELAAFEAARVEAGIALRWTTARETGNAAFEVQRRPAGTEQAWQTVGRREGAGTTDRPQDYRWTDEELPYAADSLAYRLRQVDLDGSVEVSEPIAVGRGTVQQVQLRKTYPNPARDHVTVRYAVPPSAGGPARLALFDLLGRRVRTVAAAPGEGRAKRRLDTSGLASGVYVLRLQAGGTAKTRRLTVVR
jgi:hypothetical protein